MKAKILVVDDDPDFVEVTRKVLEKHGYEVITATNGEEGLAKTRQERPDLILLDVMMSNVWDGVHMSDQLAEDPYLKKIPVIMVSSITGTPHAAFFPTDALLSVDGWISKPIAPEGLVEKVRRALGE